MKTAVVTGGTIRLGAVIAAHLRAKGWRVLTTSHRPDSGADFIADLTLPGAAEALFAAVCRRLRGRAPEAWVNNAALFSGPTRQLRAVNYRAPVRFAELMGDCAKPGSSIIHILDAMDRKTVYGRTKRDLRKALHQQVQKYVTKSVRVNAVCPGPVLVSSTVHEKAGYTPLGRPKPFDVARAVEFLLEVQSITGTELYVDGGSHIV